MKRFALTLIIVSLHVVFSFAQPKKVEDEANFLKQLEKATASIKSIESDFKQVKRLEVYDEDVISSGRFYYKAAGSEICLKYTEPYPYRIVISGSKLLMESGGRKNVTDIKDSKLMGEMQGILTACMTGSFSNLSKAYQLDFFEDSGYYLILITPVGKTLKMQIGKFEIYLNKKDLSVDKLRISETEKDYTEYIYANKKFNTIANDTLFAIAP